MTDAWATTPVVVGPAINTPPGGRTVARDPERGSRCFLERDDNRLPATPTGYVILRVSDNDRVL